MLYSSVCVLVNRDMWHISWGRGCMPVWLCETTVPFALRGGVTFILRRGEVGRGGREGGGEGRREGGREGVSIVVSSGRRNL